MWLLVNTVSRSCARRCSTAGSCDLWCAYQKVERGRTEAEQSKQVPIFLEPGGDCVNCDSACSVARSAMEQARKIIIAVDGTEVSSNAFAWAFRNLLRKTDHVIVFNAAPLAGANSLPSVDVATEYGVLLGRPLGESEAAERRNTEVSKVLVSKYLEKLKQAGISSEGEVVKGEAGSWIVDEANRLEVDAVVVGSHGYGVLTRTLLGSISDYVLHNVRSPVVIVRQTDELQEHDPLSSSGSPRKIVIAVDDSDEAVYAFKWALENFCAESDEVVIYHVHQAIQSPVTGLGTGNFGMEEVYVPPDLSSKDEVEALDESEKLVEKYMVYASNRTKIKCVGMVVPGPTEVKVCEGLKALKADAVVVGSHDRGAVARTFLGSVSDYLSHNSPCPLLVVKLPKAVPVQATEAGHKHAT